MTNQVPWKNLRSTDQREEARSTDFLAGTAAGQRRIYVASLSRTSSTLWGAGSRSHNAGQGPPSTQPEALQPLRQCSNHTALHPLTTRDRASHCWGLNKRLWVPALEDRTEFAFFPLIFK